MICDPCKQYDGTKCGLNGKPCCNGTKKDITKCGAYTPETKKEE